MEKAYIILAHKNPMQLLRLITRLDDRNSTFFVHIDKQVDLAVFQPILEYGNKIKLIEREATHWGGLGLVKATLNGLQEVQKMKVFDRVILLSGQDYPVKRNEHIDKFFKASPTGIFIEYTTIPDQNRWKENGGLYRVNKYYLGLKGYQRYTAKALNLFSNFLPPLRRKIPEGLTMYAGSQWWIIDANAVNYIINYVNENPDYTDFHKYTFAPDEVYFHTILLNSKDQQIQQSIQNSSMMHMKWQHHSSSHPEILKENDVTELIVSDKLFARKFEQEKDTDVFDLIDHILNRTETDFDRNEISFP